MALYVEPLPDGLDESIEKYFILSIETTTKTPDIVTKMSNFVAFYICFHGFTQKSVNLNHSTVLR